MSNVLVWLRRALSLSPKTTFQSTPTLWQSARQLLGTALRETGQALDRAALRLDSFGHFPSKYVGQDPPTLCQDFLSRHRPQMPLLHCGKPVVSPDTAFVAPCATLVGSVRVQPGASIWYGAVLRADTCLNAASYGQSDEDILQQGAQHLLLTDGTHENKNDKDDNEEVVDKDDEPPPLYTVKDRADSYQEGGHIHVGVDTNLQDGVLVTAREGHTILGQGVTVGHLAQLHSCTVDDFALIGMGSLISEHCRVESEALVAAGAVLPPHTHVKAGELWVGAPARKVRDLTAEERQRLHYQSSEYVKVALTHQPVEQLGGGLPPEVPFHQALLMQAHPYETTDEFLLRKNKWRFTVYRDLVPHPDAPTALEDGDSKEALEAGEQKEEETATLQSASEVVNGSPPPLQKPQQEPQPNTATSKAEGIATDIPEESRQGDELEPQIELQQTQQRQTSSR